MLLTLYKLGDGFTLVDHTKEVQRLSQNQSRNQNRQLVHISIGIRVIFNLTFCAPFLALILLDWRGLQLLYTM